MDPINQNIKPDISIIDSNKDYSGFICDLLYYEPTQEETTKLETSMTEQFAESLKERAVREIPTLLTFANFFGEAEVYMDQHSIPYSKTIRESYARAIYDDFIKNLDTLIVYNPEDSCIYVSPYIYALEFGDFYRPAVQFLTKTLQEWLNSLEGSTIN